jgi:protein-disulfide isomerase
MSGMSELLLDAPRLTAPVSPRDHALGPETAPVTLVEYGDYECPYCGAAHGVTKELVRTFGDDLRFVFRHFPLTQIHPHAARAAEAAEAAGAQGRFWQMHDLLFANQPRLAPQDLVVYARALGLDLERFMADLRDHTYAPKVREDFMSGIRSGVNGTPTFFVNGVRHNGGWDLDSLEEAVREAL